MKLTLLSDNFLKQRKKLKCLSLQLQVPQDQCNWKNFECNATTSLGHYNSPLLFLVHGILGHVFHLSFYTALMNDIEPTKIDLLLF